LHLFAYAHILMHVNKHQTFFFTSSRVCLYHHLFSIFLLFCILL